MNKEHVLAVAAAIEKHPEKFDMTNWCGTACCIAGFAYRLSGSTSDDIVHAAAEWLDIQEPMNLFIPLIDVTGPLRDIKPWAAVHVLRELAETGEIRWPQIVPVGMYPKSALHPFAVRIESDE